MTKQAYLAFCASLPGAVVDQPFEMDFDSFVARHASSRKWFALVMLHGGRDIVNLKCETLEADFFRSVYQGVTPAYHMNKRHWNSVDLHSDVPDDMLRQMTINSFDLTKK